MRHAAGFSVLIVVAGLSLPRTSQSQDQPVALDDRVAIECFAREPEIVTPTGIAVDSRGRVLVIECHTHFRPAGYEGPPADRLRLFTDSDGDGRADKITTFFEGTTATMGIGIAADGWVYVATRNEIFKLRDTDADDRADDRRQLARLETLGNYPHNGLTGFAFDCRGEVYFSCGENLGAKYQLVGADGTVLSGGGEGGSVYHIRPDGGGLWRVATGFWNPFHLAIDPFERLYAIDNDPDSRPPCRLLQIVPGGDYGYRYRNGRKGLHPFTAWNGELPGTLPMLAGTGEAPSGVVSYQGTNLPDDYRGELLTTSWGDHRLERFRPQRRGASFRATARPWVTGGENFRPVGMAVAHDGSLFVSDWVDKSYELHRQGRIWHVRGRDRSRRPAANQPIASVADSDAELTTRAARWKNQVAGGKVTSQAVREALGDRSVDLQSLVVRTLPGELAGELAPLVDALEAGAEVAAEVRAELLRRAPPAMKRATLLTACADPDPFILSAAVEGLRRTTTTADWMALSESDQVSLRLASVLLLQASTDEAAVAALGQLLSDPAPEVRFAAIEWAAGARRTELRPRLLAGLAAGGVTRRLFEGYLAALEQLDAVAPKIETVSVDQPFVAPVRDVSGQDYVAQLLADGNISPELCRRGVRMLDPAHPLLAGEKLSAWLRSNDPGLRLEAIRSLRETSRPDRTRLLLEVAGDATIDEQLRAEAVVGLNGDTTDSRKFLVQLASEAVPTLRHEALRSLRGSSLAEDERRQLAGLQSSAGDATAALLAILLAPAQASSGAGASSEPGTAAVDIDHWITRLDGPADPRAGERIYFHPQGPLCYRCHQIDGRGGKAGPDLTNTPQTLARRRLIESIVDPSKEIAPQYVTWSIARSDGTTAVGMLLGEAVDGEQTYADDQGNVFTLLPDEIAERAPQTSSLMPRGLVDRMTVQEFRDLLAFLLERRD